MKKCYLKLSFDGNRWTHWECEAKQKGSTGEHIRNYAKNITVIRKYKLKKAKQTLCWPLITKFNRKTLTGPGIAIIFGHSYKFSPVIIFHFLPTSKFNLCSVPWFDFASQHCYENGFATFQKTMPKNEIKISCQIHSPFPYKVSINNKI